jgi:hypothetical protein
MKRKRDVTTMVTGHDLAVLRNAQHFPSFSVPDGLIERLQAIQHHFEDRAEGVRNALVRLSVGLPSLCTMKSFHSGYGTTTTGHDSAYHGVFGLEWVGHGLGSPFEPTRLLELQATGRLAEELDPAKSGKQAELRCRAFLEALFQCVTAADHAFHAPSLAGINGLDIRAEEPVDSSAGVAGRPKSIDLWIGWKDADLATHLVLIEAKTGLQPSTSEALRAYERHGRKSSLSDEPVCIYLTTDGRKAPMSPGKAAPHLRWKPVGWFDLLRRWESRLAIIGADPKDTEFKKFRRNLWETCVN